MKYLLPFIILSTSIIACKQDPCRKLEITGSYVLKKINSKPPIIKKDKKSSGSSIKLDSFIVYKDKRFEIKKSNLNFSTGTWKYFVHDGDCQIELLFNGTKQKGSAIPISGGILSCYIPKGIFDHEEFFELQKVND